jgi:beta-1,4-N-acetylglucosaminyltransferase
MKIALAASAGGHLTQVRKLETLYRNYDYFFVTFYAEPLKDLSKSERFYFVLNPGRNIIKFLLNAVQSLGIFLKEKPDVVISTGAGVAIAMCWWARLFGRKVIFLEDWCVVKRPSLSGRLVYPAASLFIVQWESLLKYYPKAIFKGALL